MDEGKRFGPIDDVALTIELALLLAQDGISTGAIYVLIALGIVLVFLVTRVIFVPFGDLVAYASLTLAALQERRPAGMMWLVLALATTATAVEAATLLRARRADRLPRAILFYLVLPALPALAAWLSRGVALPGLAAIGLTLALVLPVAPLLYRITFRPVADAPVLVLLMLSVVLHFALAGVALLCFGPEGARPLPLTDAVLEIGGMIFPGQTLLMFGACALASLLLYGFFARTTYGKALRATAMNRTGARLVGIRPQMAGAAAFLLASLLAGVSGILIGPVATLAYDSGFVLGLKAFVGAIIGGLVSYPAAALGALFVGMLESYVAFYDSSSKEVVVFAALVPILLLRSVLAGDPHDSERDEP